jgi:tetratricopeptide (TPR) repeat protein
MKQLMWGRHGLFFLSLGLIPAQGQADPVTLVTTQSQPGETDPSEVRAALASAEKQYAARDYPALRATLAALLALPKPHLEALFLSGMTAMAEGNYATAATAFRAMLARDPSLVRPRLELALALQKLGDRQGAKYHYEQVLAAPLPEPVLRNIYRQLLDIREREPSLKLSLELSSDSNPRQTTDSRVVYIGGLPYLLNDANRAKTAYGMAVTADLHLPRPADPTWFTHFYAEAFEYPERDLDSAYGQASAGKRFEYGQHTISLEAGGHVSQYQDRQQFAGALVRVGGFYRLKPKIGISSSVQLRSFNYPSLPFLDGTESQLNAMSIFVPAPEQRFETGVGINHYDAAESPYSYLQRNLNVRYVHELPGGWITGLRAEARSTRYEAPDPFFMETRHDNEGRLEIDLLNRTLKWWTLSPRAIVGYVKRDSNLDLYRYNRVYGRLGLTREF